MSCPWPSFSVYFLYNCVYFISFVDVTGRHDDNADEHESHGNSLSTTASYETYSATSASETAQHAKH